MDLRKADLATYRYLRDFHLLLMRNSSFEPLVIQNVRLSSINVCTRRFLHSIKILESPIHHIIHGPYHTFSKFQVHVLAGRWKCPGDVRMSRLLLVQSPEYFLVSTFPFPNTEKKYHT